MSLTVALSTLISFLTASFSGIPVNDNCEDAIAISNGETPFSNIDATTDGPSHAECAVGSDGGQTGNDIWYLYTATETGTVTISTCDDADFDTDLVLYDSNDCNTLALLACNDDGDNCSGFTSHLEAEVTDGLTYLLRVGGYMEGDVGTGTLSISVTPDGVSWIGEDGDSWFDEENWSSGEVPDSNTDLIISGSVVIDGPGAVAQSIYVTKGGKIRLSSTTSSLTASITITEGGMLQWDAGTIDISNGTLDISDDLYIGCNEDATLIADVGYIYADSVTVCDNGEISGYFRAYADIFINHGVIELGGYYSYSKVYGNFEQSEDGTLITSISSATTYKRLNVDDGTTTIAGTLICNSENGYSPPDGTTFMNVVNNYDDLHDGGFDSIIANGFNAGTNVSQASTDDGIHINFSVDTIWYVDSAGSISNTGTSWGDAFPSPQLAFPNTSPGDQVWIKEGTYTPAFVPGSGTPGTDRSATFSIPNGVEVYGGFDGTETSNSQRDPEANPTILSGNIGNLKSASDDSYHVVTFAPSEWSYALLDSVLVTKGKATGPASTNDNVGAGVYNETGTLFIFNCTIIDNGADDYGGGLYSDDGWFYLGNCTIENNKIVDVQGGGPGFDDWGGNGGGVALTNSAGTYISDCKFIDNYASYGGGIYGGSECWFNIADSLFVTNRALSGGGAIRVNDCTFNVTDCAFNFNMTTDLIIGSGGGGAIYASESDTEIETTSFNGNSTSGNGGAIYFDSNSTTQVPFINACTFEQNTGHKGSAFYASNSGSNYVYIANCLIAGNDGPAVQFSVGTSGSRMTNCTVAYNENMGTSAAVTGIVSIENSILWQNTGSYGRSTFNQYNGPITVTRSLIDNTTSTGEIINNDPFFRSVTGPDGLPRTGDEDYRLLPSSPAIDQGKNGEFDYPGETQDLDGNDRFVDDPYTDDYDSENSPNIDMGCYEYQPSSIGDNGIRRWAYEGESIVSYLNDSNWEPEDAPGLQNVTVHSTRLDTIITTTLSQDHSIQRLIVPQGYVYYALLGNTLTMSEEHNTFMIGHYDTPAYFILLDGTIIADRIDMQGGISTASLGINSNSTLVADSGAIVRDRSTLYGEGTVDGDLILSGTITCDYSHVGYPNVTGNLSMNDHPVTDIDDSGTIRYYFDPYDGDANNDYDSIEVGGDVNLGGLLYLYGGGQVAENAGDQAIVIDAEGSINGEFDSVWAHYFSEDLVPVVSYVTNANGNEQVVVDIHSVSSLLGFGDPNSTGVASQPVDAETGDIDGDTYPDLVLSIPDSDSILILFNDGVSNGEWQGFNGGSQQISVGDNPAGLTIGDFDDDGDMDIAVANTNDDTVSVLVNQDVPDFAGRGVTFNTVTHATDFYGDAEDIEALPKDVAHGNFNGDSFVDLAIANSGDAMVAVINGPVTSAGMFPSGGNYGAPGGASGIDPGDVNNDKDLDVINTTGEDGKTTVLKGNTALAGGELYDNPIVLNMGGGFGEQVITDLDGNGLDDVVTTDIASNTLNIALQRNNGTFAPPVHLPLGGSNPNSLTALDMDDDGDIDLAVVRENEDGEKVTSLYRNDSPDGSTTVYFTDIGTEEGEGLNPIMARASDVDGDGNEDLLMISESSSFTGTGYSSETVLNDLPEEDPCPADLNGDDFVNVDDLLLLIAAWGNTSGDEDINSDGSVNVDDMLLLIAAWGSCPR